MVVHSVVHPITKNANLLLDVKNLGQNLGHPVISKSVVARVNLSLPNAESLPSLPNAESLPSLPNAESPLVREEAVHVAQTTDPLAHVPDMVLTNWDVYPHLVAE